MNNIDYLYIYPFCFITPGKKYFSIYDSMHKKMHKFDIELYDIAKNQFRNKTINDLISEFDDNDRDVILSFISYLIDNQLGRCVHDINRFPLLKEQWDSPFSIKRCMIDIRDKWHDFSKIFNQLSSLLCPKIEIRAYRRLSIDEIDKIVKSFQDYSFRALFLVLPYDDSLFQEDSVERLSAILNNEYRVMLNIYDVKEDKLPNINEIKDKNNTLSYAIYTSSKHVTGCDCCGVINHDNFHELAIDDVMEIKNFNGCLNRLISVDEEGAIKNCPSMTHSYGNIDSSSLIDISNTSEFRKYWYITNSMIDGCKDCELRVICHGCRAYISDPANLFSKPLKCDYQP